MRDRLAMTSLVCGLTILVAGCEFTSSGELNPAAPSQVEITPVLLGTWSINSAAAGGTGLPSAESCTELEFDFTEENGDVYTGTFRATCAGGVELAGTATGTYTDGVLTVTASGTATTSGVAQCPFTLSGTARLTNNRIEVEYSGTSCLGSVSGSEVLDKT